MTPARAELFASGSDAPIPPQTRSDSNEGVIRRIEDQDRAEVSNFMERLCSGSRRYRFLGQMADSAGLLARGLTQFDFEPDTSFGAVNARGEIMGIARYSLDADGCKCECTVIQSDRWPDPRLGLALMRRLIGARKVLRPHAIAPVALRARR